MDQVQLGPFVLEERIGEGGMGAVWRASHIETGWDVAVKVLTAERTREDRYRREFRREIQALAKLHHDSIASIADYGTIDDEAAEHHADEFVAGAPWFAMEYIGGENLSETGDWTWARLKLVILALLDGLAHAHAKGIIHRDLKPSNVMVARDDRDDRPNGPKLVDFGIAQLDEPRDRSGAEQRRVTGTPSYMAPEQIAGQSRDQGPWTDLYALGCMVWQTVCAEPPVEGETTNEILRGHLNAQRGDFRPAMAVPEGLEQWLGSLLQRQPGARPKRAADAAWALFQLGDVEDSRNPRREGAAPTETGEFGPALATLAATARVEPDPTIPPMADVPDATIPDPSPPPADRLPPMPEHWRREGAPGTTSPMPKAGLQLFGLREVPLVDRDAIRDHLWHQLRRVREAGRARAVLLEGPAGRGKSRIAEWLYRRVAETGVSTPLRAIHTLRGGPNQGFPGMLRRFFHAQELHRGEFFERLRQRRPPLRPGSPLGTDKYARAVTELVYPTADDAAGVEGPPYKFAGPEHRYAMLRQVLGLLGDRRPLLLWLDDLQWSNDSLGFLEHLWKSPGDPPSLLVVGTLRSDVVAEDGEFADRLERLEDADAVTRTELSPLSGIDHRALIEAMLDLAPKLVEMLVERTEGNPLFAMQILSSWIENEDLVAGDRGYELEDDRDLELPRDIHGLWSDRIERVLASFDTTPKREILRALELAAALGREVDQREWNAILTAAETQEPAGLIRTLVDRGLARREKGGWSFAHGLLVESLARQARERGRWENHHRSCARGLESLLDSNVPGPRERIAEHWIEAGELEHALGHLFEESKLYGRRAEYDAAWRTWNERGELLDRLGTPPNDKRRLEQSVLAARLLGVQGEYDRAEKLALGVRDQLDSIDDPWLDNRTADVLGSIAQRRGDPDGGEQWTRLALETAQSEGNAKWETRAHYHLARQRFFEGDLDEAERRARLAVEAAERGGDRYTKLHALRVLASMRQAKGDESSRVKLERVCELAREAGYPHIEAQATNSLGELARLNDDLQRAREHYEDFYNLVRDFASPFNEGVALLNLAQTEIAAGEFQRAEECLESAQRTFDSLGTQSRDITIAVARLTLAASVGDWRRFDAKWNAFQDGWSDDGPLQTDFPWLLERAAEFCLDAGEARRARDVLGLAHRLWDRLGNDEGVERVERLQRAAPD